MRILIVSMLYAPAVSPRAFRWHAIARRWVDQGHEVHVVCGGEANSPALETLDGVRIRRVDDLPRRWRRGSPPAGQVAATARGAARGGAARRIIAAAWRALYWPDYACLWYRPALRAAMTCLRETRFDALVTVALPFTAHLVGLQLRPLVPVWLADSGDPFTFNEMSPVNNTRLYRWLNHAAEARVLRRCDRFTVTMEGARQQYLDRFTVDPAKLRVIPPLAGLTPLPGGDAPAAGGKRRLAFLGTLFPGLREPGPLLAALRRLPAVEPALAAGTEVHLYGTYGGFTEELQAAAAAWPGLKLHGVIDRDAVRGVLAEVDGLINIGNATPYQLPSKLVEYAATGKPILNLVVDPADASAGFLAGYPLATTLLAQGGRLPEPALHEFLHTMLGRRLGVDAVAAFLAPYTPGRIADDYMAELIAAQPAATSSR